MLHDLSIDEWHSFFVMTGEEEKAKERIKYRLQDGYKVVVPKRKLKIRKGGSWVVESRVLFPGYVLVNGAITAEIYYRLKNIPNVFRLLKTGDAVSTIDRHEMAVLSKLMCNSEEIGFSNVLFENGRVRVVDGPLFSLEGIIMSIDCRKKRAKVRIPFLGEERTIDLGISVLKPV